MHCLEHLNVLIKTAIYCDYSCYDPVYSLAKTTGILLLNYRIKFVVLGNETNVGLSMMCYRIRKRRKDVLGGGPVEGKHREVIVFSVPDSKLLPEVLEGVKGM